MCQELTIGMEAFKVPEVLFNPVVLRNQRREAFNPAVLGPQVGLLSVRPGGFGLTVICLFSGSLPIRFR